MAYGQPPSRRAVCLAAVDPDIRGLPVHDYRTSDFNSKVPDLAMNDQPVTRRIE